MVDFKGHRFAKDIILICVRWYLAYPLSYRNLKEMMAERGVQVDHSNIYRWVQKFAPKLEAAFRRSGSKRPVGKSCYVAIPLSRHARFRCTFRGTKEA